MKRPIPNLALHSVTVAELLMVQCCQLIDLLLPYHLTVYYAMPCADELHTDRAVAMNWPPINQKRNS